jgi:hypothetical protein
MIKREIYYRLLGSPHGQSIAQLAPTGSHTQRIAAAIKQLKPSAPSRSGSKRWPPGSA